MARELAESDEKSSLEDDIIPQLLPQVERTQISDPFYELTLKQFKARLLKMRSLLTQLDNQKALTQLFMDLADNRKITSDGELLRCLARS